MKNYTFKRGFFQVFGLLLLALGVSGVLIGGLGSGAVDSVSFGFNKLTNLFDQGTWNFIINGVLVLILLILTKKPKVLLSLIVLFLMTFFINWGLDLFEWIFNITLMDTTTGISNNLFVDGQVFNAIWVSVVSLLSMALGVALLIVYKGILSPYDESVVFIDSKIKNYSISKIIVDGFFMLFGLVLGIINGSPFEQIGIFSVITVIVLGPTINLFIKIFSKGENENGIE